MTTDFPMRFSLLASGSTGNSLLIEQDTTRLLVDCGISCRQLLNRLQLHGIDPGTLTAVCLTHDHSDHIQGLSVLLRRHPLPVYATEGTCTGAECRLRTDAINWTVFSPGNPFRIGALTLEPFAVPHDAGDPVGFVVHNGTSRTAAHPFISKAVVETRAQVREAIKTRYIAEVKK